MEKIRRVIEQCLASNPCSVEYRFNEPMSGHTSFKVGGPADCWVRPLCGESREDSDESSFEKSFAFAAALIHAAQRENIPLFILGGGANIAVSDKGIRGITLDTGGWTGVICGAAIGAADCGGPAEMVFLGGTKSDEAADMAAKAGLGGLEFLAGMPGCVGGALWMNARAYGQEMANVVTSAEVLDFSAGQTQRRIVHTKKTEFAYKHSPFQNQQWLILTARLSLHPREKSEIYKTMEEHRRDREAKGHYLFPSAGSAFKNNHSFGKPTGQIIDELGLKGLRMGGAQIAPFHGNIIINTGGATAQNIRDLVQYTALRVKEACGFTLEPEILFAGEW
ncbi:MAG: UDP-N-acetylmuramate dehydrogenase [Treponema sp.]|nr:UDP-N-acetylmuramate dehydrogenase [Treponema sp.]